VTKEIGCVSALLAPPKMVRRVRLWIGRKSYGPANPIKPAGSVCELRPTSSVPPPCVNQISNDGLAVGIRHSPPML
jgi:hypothetical protein